MEFLAQHTTWTPIFINMFALFSLITLVMIKMHAVYVGAPQQMLTLNKLGSSCSV